MKGWNKTSVSELLKIQYPIIQGPFGRGGSTTLLAAIVSNAGGLGSFGANDLSPDQISKVAADIRKLTDKPFNINLWVSTFDKNGDALDIETYSRVVKVLQPYYKELKIKPPDFSEMPSNKAKSFDDQVAALIDARPHVFSFVFGIPSAEILRACRKQNIITAGAASTVEEALLMAEAGVDLVVASGFEAGGHRPSFLKNSEDSLIGTFALVPQIADAVEIPVIAAGGIADGRGIAAALTLGASGVQLGTAFLACEESGVSDLHRALLFKNDARSTMLSRSFTGRLARGLENRFGVEMQAHRDIFAAYPAQSWILAPLRAAAVDQKRTDLVNLWAGQAAPLTQHHNAAELFDALVKETNMIFETRDI